MPTKRQVLKAVDEKVRGIYSVWIIGVSQNPYGDRTFLERRGVDIFQWSEWEVEAFKEAIEIERYYVEEMGMKGSGDYNDLQPNKTTYVYVF